jgi:hypothetical protein
VPVTFHPLTVVSKFGGQVVDAVELNYPSVCHAAKALPSAIVEKLTEFSTLRQPRTTYQREAPPYQTLDKLHPGVVHPQTLTKAATRAPQFHLSPEQFNELSKENPRLAWVAQNARFQKMGMCHGEAFAEVRRMHGMPLEKSRENMVLDTFYSLPTDFKQRRELRPLNAEDLAKIVRDKKVVVWTGEGQLVAGDSYQRLVESGLYSTTQMAEGMNHGAVACEVKHSVILIADQSIPEGHVLVYDMDPFCKRYADLHHPVTGIPPGHSIQPDPHFIPEGSRHHAVRIVSFEGLINETGQCGIMPKVMFLPEPESTALPETASGGRLIGE